MVHHRPGITGQRNVCECHVFMCPHIVLVANEYTVRDKRRPEVVADFDKRPPLVFFLLKKRNAFRLEYWTYVVMV